MFLRNRNQVVNVVTAIVAGLVLCAVLLLMLFLFLSPNLR